MAISVKFINFVKIKVWVKQPRELNHSDPKLFYLLLPFDLIRRIWWYLKLTLLNGIIILEYTEICWLSYKLKCDIHFFRHGAKATRFKPDGRSCFATTKATNSKFFILIIFELYETINYEKCLFIIEMIINDILRVSKLLK